MLLAVVAVIFAVAYVINLIQAVFGIMKMAHPERMFYEIPNGHSVLATSQNCASTRAWAREHGFEPATILERFGRIGFTKQRVTIEVWRNNRDAITLETYSHERRFVMEFTTDLAPSGELVTCNNFLVHLLLPMPGHFFQSFTSMDLSELLERHREALAHLRTHQNLRPVPPEGSCIDATLRATRAYYIHIRSMPFWPVRIALRNFGPARWAHGRSIAKQFPA